MGKHYVKEYETPKSMPCYFLLDTSASMTVSSVARSKYATMLFIAGGLALAFLDRVSPVGAVSVGGRALHVRPSLSQARVLEWLLALQHFRYDETTALGGRIGELLPSLSSRAMFVVLSDLHDPEALPGLKRLSQLHDCVVIQLRDPAEAGVRGSGFLRAREAETGREFTTTGRRRWTDPARAAHELRRAGIDHLLVPTDRPFEPALRHLFKARDGVGRGAR